MTYTPTTADAINPALKRFRQALANRETRPVDILFVGDSVTEGYYSTEDRRRWVSLLRQQLQSLYNPSGIPGGEGYIPACHSVGAMFGAGAPTGAVNLPQRAQWVGGGSSFNDGGFGIGRRMMFMSAATHYWTMPFYGDRFWALFTMSNGLGWAGIAIDGKFATVSTQGALSGTATGTFVVNDPEGWPTGFFVITVDDEDMLVQMGTGASYGTMTISTRGYNGTTAASHVVGASAQWAPAGVQRVNTYSATVPNRQTGHVWDSGPLIRDNHTVTIVPISRTGAGSNTWSVIFEGLMLFDGDGGSSRSTFNDGAFVGTTVAAGSNAVNVNTFTGSGTLNVVSTTNFPASGSVNVVTGSGLVTLSYTGVTATTLTGVNANGGAGVLSAGGAVTSQTFQSSTATFTSADLYQSVTGINVSGGSTITAVVSATQVTLSAPGLATVTGVLFTLGGRGTGIRVWEGGHASYTSAAFAGATQIVAASNGVSLPNGTIHVGTTALFPASGTALIMTSAGEQTVAYTGVTATTLTGCTGGTGTMSTGSYVVAAGANSYWADALNNVDPDLVFVEFGINDAGGSGESAAVFTQYLQNLVTLINARSMRAPSYVFIVPYNTSAYTAAQWQPYVQAIYQAASIVGAAVWDLSQQMGPLPTAWSELSVDGTHPNDQGASEVALAGTRFMTGREAEVIAIPTKYDNSLALKAFRAALGNRKNRPVDVVLVGDSITEGYYAASDASRYSSLFRQTLQAQYSPSGMGGEGFIPALHTIGGMYAATAPSGYANLPQRWAFGGVGAPALPTTDYGYGLGRRAVLLGTTATATITVYCDRFWIMFTGGSGTGTLSVAIDGGTAQTFNTVMGTGAQSGRVWDSGALAPGQHTVVVTASAGTIILDGIMVFLGDCQDVTITDGQTTSGSATLTSVSAAFTPSDAVLGRKLSAPANSPIPSGASIKTYVSPTQVTMSTNANATSAAATVTIAGRGSGIRVWEGGRAGVTSAAFAGPLEAINGYWADGLDAIDPRLVIVQIGINDIGNGVSPAIYQNNLIAIVNVIRQRAPSRTSIVFEVGWVPGGSSTDNWQPYRDAMYAVAATMGCGIIDLSNSIPQAPSSGSTELFADTLHLSDAGQQVSVAEHRWSLDLLDFPTPIPQQFAVPGGPLLTNPKFIRVAQTYSSGSVLNVYTAPAGRKALVLPPTISTNAGSSTTVKLIRGTLGTNPPFGTMTIIASSQTTSQAPFLLNPGETFSILESSNNVLNFFCSIIEFDDTDSLVIASLFPAASGAQRLYTCPAGKTAKILDAGGDIGYGFGAYNNSASAVTVTFGYVPSGGNLTTAVLPLTAAAQSIAANVGGAPTGTPSLTLGPGDALTINPSAASLDAYVIMVEVAA